MTDTIVEIDRLPIEGLLDRYGISRSVLYERMGGLRIKTVKVGGRSYLNKDAIASLDALHQHIRSSGTMAEFLELKNGQLTIPGKWDNNDRSDVPSTTTFIQLVHEIAAALRPAVSPLQHLEELEHAVTHGWLLSTSETKRLIGVKPHGNTYTRGSFAFIRSGKIGGSAAWKVQKIQ